MPIRAVSVYRALQSLCFALTVGNGLLFQWAPSVIADSRQSFVALSVLAGPSKSGRLSWLCGVCVLTKAVGLCAGTVIQFEVANRYNTYRFGGHKVRCYFSPDAMHSFLQNETTCHIPHCRTCFETIEHSVGRQLAMYLLGAFTSAFCNYLASWRLAKGACMHQSAKGILCTEQLNCNAVHAEHCAEHEWLDGRPQPVPGDSVSGGGWPGAADIGGVPVRVPPRLLRPHQAAQIWRHQPAVMEPCQVTNDMICTRKCRHSVSDRVRQPLFGTW